MFRIYVERKEGFQNEASRFFSEIRDFLGIKGVTDVRYLNRYDIENISKDVAMSAATRIFSEPQSDLYTFSEITVEKDETVIAWEYLPGQYDQRADSSRQCLLLLREDLSRSVRTEENPPLVYCAKMLILKGNLSAEDIKKIENYVINPVDSRLASHEIPETLVMKTKDPEDIEVLDGFISLDERALETLRLDMGLAMDFADIKFLQDYFKKENRNPTETEVRVLDTYWSDHCRHTTFLTELGDIQIEDGPYSQLFKKSLENYNSMRDDLYAKKSGKPVTLMDMATIGAKYLRKHGKLDDLEVSEENNACSIYIDVHYTADKNGNPVTKSSENSTERWLLMFKNETHNHPTEIEPFGGAATCIGGAIRDPLSGRSWVYQSMRITGAGDPTVPLSQTLPGKLPQIKLVREAAQGFSSYGNQIGLTTGQVTELYHEGYRAKRMELGAVIAAAPADTVIRKTPEKGDAIILLGGGTGRDGIGGATGSSKVHTKKSVTTAAAEVQKGNAVEERKIQRLFRNPDVSLMIRRCNDFGAGGVSVAVGELAPGLDIDLDAVPKKYEGLNGTELAISESQERMAVVVKKEDVAKFIKAAAEENLQAVAVAAVTDTNRLVMRWRKKVIVDIAREFLDAAGAPHKANALIESPAKPEGSPLVHPLSSVSKELKSKAEPENRLKSAWLKNMADLACCSQRGLGERFDGSIGSSSVLFPYGGRRQATPEAGMAAKIPVLSPSETSTVSLMSFGFDPGISEWSPWHGSQISVLSSLAKILCMGGRPDSARLSFQEFFGRAVDEKTWGYPAAALLGALYAQNAMGTASIGGKDSMSGSFENMNVPHTLVSFAVTHEEVKNVTSGSFKKSGSSVYLVLTPYSEKLVPDFKTFNKNANTLYRHNSEGKIFAMYPVCAGGIAEAVTKMAMGNNIGMKITSAPKGGSVCGMDMPSSDVPFSDLFTPFYGAVIVETDFDLETDPDLVHKTVIKLGETQKSPEITIYASASAAEKDSEPVSIPLKEAEAAWESTLSKVFPTKSGKNSLKDLPDFAKKTHPSVADVRKNPVFKTVSTKPLVLLPVFPGTNCEYDMARAFNLAGAKTKILVFKNNTQEALKASLKEFEKAISEAQILALSGGFSAGDEPDGSGKFIANVLRQNSISDAVMSLLEKRNGLILGICNGFQALIKTGLLPYGKIIPITENMPTLTFNTIGRHISRISRTKIVSAVSPWAQDPSVIEDKIHLVPVSHGEGRIFMRTEEAKFLFENGQIFSQYADEQGRPALSEPDNPNGSLFAIEGITSPCGKILGKMGHSERTIGSGKNGCSRDLIKNVAGDPLTNEHESSCQNIFAAGVRYFY
ncbi:phosphoribosylformylglycinamidine synthase [Treponema parvum]|uniref:Phosphoribosylformylglycinamidine synthase n=1 Tax=Treponema parvum TaxID=138851 RepID=A0A975IDG5_9SPIR|nr:phosphoribosylformylglycinamidine synthase [Treponema parvum]QTQ12763.1 phosphoribosylformylglycinamidine synthase [Treponema parvum]